MATASHTISETSDPSGRYELTQTERRRLQDGTNDHDARADHDGSLASEDVAEPDSRNSAEEASQSVATNCDTLDIGRLACRPAIWGRVDVYLREQFEKASQSEKAAHHA